MGKIVDALLGRNEHKICLICIGGVVLFPFFILGATIYALCGRYKDRH